MSFRGYPQSLIERVQSYGNHYLDPETLKAHDSYMGEIIHSYKDLTIFVESSRAPQFRDYPRPPREYRVVFAHFGDTLTLRRTENYATKAQAINAYKEDNLPL